MPAGLIREILRCAQDDKYVVTAPVNFTVDEQ